MSEPQSRLVMTPKRQLLGRRLVLQLHMVLRTMRIHDPTNKALLIATENLRDTINTLWASLDGVVQIQFVEGVVYLNDMRLRLEFTIRDQVLFLQREFEVREMGGLAFSRPVDSVTLRNFILAFVRPIESQKDVESMRRSLEEFKELALELLGPKEFSDGESEDSELRIDRKTFAVQTYSKAIIATREFVHAIRDGNDPMAGKLPLTRIVQDLVDIATERVNFLLKLSAIKQAFDYDFNHAANTCVLSIILGRALNIGRVDLVDLGTAALLADVGFALVSSDMAAQDAELSPKERVELHEAMIRQIRSIIGRGKLNDAMIRRVIVAYEHHKPYRDPETKKVAKIHIFSRVVAVADAFDALTTRRPWREGYTADEALNILLRDSGQKFDPLVVRVLVNLMGLYPLGSAVRLDSGEIAVVYHNSHDPKFFEKPWVKVVRDADGNAIKGTAIRNLADHDGAGNRVVRMARGRELGGLDAGMCVVL